MKNSRKGTETYAAVPVDKIVSTSNRKHGGMGEINILARNIQNEGLISPPTAVDCGDGTYRIIAGRRRIAAIRQLGWKEVTVRVIDEADADHLESIGLSENVNRLEMHPLDEAELFKKLLDNGTDIKDIADLHDRSISGIQHRVRLCNLNDELKEMFRDEMINLSGAALLASLPDKDQAKFAKKYERAETEEIARFIYQAQHCVITLIADEQCENCKKRTNNTEPGLFTDLDWLEDVCFDQDCYTKKWQSLIGGLIAREDFQHTENNIILDKSIPKFLPDKTATVVFWEVGEAEYKILPQKGYSWSKTSAKAKNDTAWLISKPYNTNEVKVERVKYKKHERQDYSSYSTPSDPVKEFHIDQVFDIAPEDQKTAAQKVKEKHHDSWNFSRKVKNLLLKAIIDKRIREKNRENLAREYLIARCSGMDDAGKWHDIDPDYQDIFQAIFKTKSVGTLFAGFPDDKAEPVVQKLFLFIIATSISWVDLPGIDDTEEEWFKTESSLFWKFAQLTREEYAGMYRKVLGDLVKEA
jgi:ParB/RepB/Spo0J family partition protein